MYVLYNRLLFSFNIISNTKFYVFISKTHDDMCIAHYFIFISNTRFINCEVFCEDVNNNLECSKLR